MTHADFLDLLTMTFGQLRKLSGSKGQEYANSDDQLANFRRLSEGLGSSPEAVCYTYLAKHLDAIQSHIRRPSLPLSEPIDGRIDDAILYLVLLKALMADGALPDQERAASDDWHSGAFPLAGITDCRGAA